MMQALSNSVVIIAAAVGLSSAEGHIISVAVIFPFCPTSEGLSKLKLKRKGDSHEILKRLKIIRSFLNSSAITVSAQAPSCEFLVGVCEF